MVVKLVVVVFGMRGKTLVPGNTVDTPVANKIVLLVVVEIMVVEMVVDNKL